VSEENKSEMVSSAGRNNFVLFEPTNHIYRVAEVALEAGLNLVAVCTDEPFALGRDEAVKKSFDRIIYVESWDDPEAIFQLLDNSIGIDSVAGTYAAVEITLMTEARVRVGAGLPANSVEALSRSIDKAKMRAVLREHALTDLGSIPVSEVLAKAKWPYAGTAFVKPARGGGSTGVIRCGSLDHLADVLVQSEKSIQEARPLIRNHAQADELLLEEAAQGTVFSFETLTSNGVHHGLGITTQFKLVRNDVAGVGALFPYATEFEDRVRDKIFAALTAVGISHGAVHTEFALSNDGKVEIIEINPRFAGADILDLLSFSLKQNVAESLFHLAIGGELKLPRQDLKSTALLRYIMPPEGVSHFESIEYPEQGLEQAKTWKTPGYSFSETPEMKDYIFGFIITAPDPASAYSRMDTIMDAIRVNGLPVTNDVNNDILPVD
jgi:biotin carboxylase